MQLKIKCLRDVQQDITKRKNNILTKPEFRVWVKPNKGDDYYYSFENYHEAWSYLLYLQNDKSLYVEENISIAWLGLEFQFKGMSITYKTKDKKSKTLKVSEKGLSWFDVLKTIDGKI